MGFWSYYLCWGQGYSSAWMMQQLSVILYVDIPLRTVIVTMAGKKLCLCGLRALMSTLLATIAATMAAVVIRLVVLCASLYDLWVTFQDS